MTAQQGMADCWSFGKNCLEWNPNQLAADELCLLANSTAPVEASALSSAEAQAAAVTSSIWHKDSGTKVSLEKIECRAADLNAL